MYSFSESSKEKLKTTHIDLIQLFSEVIKLYDFAVIDGRRDKEAQNRAFHAGNSSKKYPDSKHNQTPSRAVDIFPAPYDWDDIDAFYEFSEIVFAVAKRLDIEIIWGGHFEWEFDGPHWELCD